MSALDLDALEAAARAATPGPWTFTDYEGSTHVWCGRHMSSMVADNHTEGAIARVRGFGAGLPIVENAAFIAACDPTTVLALIARLRAAEARTAWQPIETAPLNQWMTGLHGDRSKPPRVVMRIPTDVAALGFHDEYGDRIRGLTHWMPLPAAPEAP